MLRLTNLIGLFILFVTSVESADFANSWNLFLIQRSNSSNEVHCDALIESCVWVRPEVDAS